MAEFHLGCWVQRSNQKEVLQISELVFYSQEIAQKGWRTANEINNLVIPDSSLLEAETILQDT